ncbi:peptidase [Streptomyces sp. TRM66268-LWL]|uniref:Peptidase n=1 Tax=Streptomyces polyasparticus TaxID=2767826 RepID=A0ABR7SXI7_9ACTN|nr:peptidase [Streptomyces polyasparticus]
MNNANSPQTPAGPSGPTATPQRITWGSNGLPADLRPARPSPSSDGCERNDGAEPSPINTQEHADDVASCDYPAASTATGRGKTLRVQQGGVVANPMVVPRLSGFAIAAGLSAQTPGSAGSSPHTPPLTPARTPGPARSQRGGREPASTVSTASRPVSPRMQQSSPRSAPPLEPDPSIIEFRGPGVSGWWAVFTGLVAIVGVSWLAWLTGRLPEPLQRAAGLSVQRPTHMMAVWEWGVVGAWGVIAIFAFGGLTRGRTGSAWVLTLFGQYRGTVRRTGLVWISPLLLRRRMDVRLRHWRSDPMAAVDAQGSALRVVLVVVWRVTDTARALFSVDDHTTYLREQVEAAMARVLSQLPADAFQGESPTLRDAETVGDRLAEILTAACRPVGIAVISAHPTHIEYAPEVAAAMQRRQIAAIDAKHRDSVLTSVVDAVDDTVTRLSDRGLVELDDYERKALVKDLTVAFYTARGTAATEQN